MVLGWNDVLTLLNTVDTVLGVVVVVLALDRLSMIIAAWRERRRR